MKCQTCGHNADGYEAQVTPIQVRSLRELAHAGGGPLNPRIDLPGLTKSQYTTFAQLGWFGLAEKTRDASGKRVAGLWHITQLGTDFLAGDAAIYTHITMLNAKPIAHHGMPQLVHEVQPYAGIGVAA